MANWLISAVVRPLRRWLWRALIRKNRLVRSCRRALGTTTPARPFPPLPKYQHGCYSTFFGYFDKTPFSADNSRLLAGATPLRRSSPSGTDELVVGYFELDDPDRLHPIGKTTTWCWQQGCMLQWLPYEENDLVLYNRAVGGRHGAVSQNVHNRKVQAEFDRPIYCVSSNGKVGISRNFARLYRLRPGYGYAGMSDPFQSDPSPVEDGLWRVDLESGESTLLHSIRQLAEIEPQPGMNDAEHYLNHAMFNPAGDRFVVFHLWTRGSHRYIRMFTCNEDGSDLFLLTNEKMVSHFDWKSDSQLMAYAVHAGQGRHFYLYEDRTHDRRVVAPDLLPMDGHPSYSPHGNLLLCDTYPDPCGEQHLFVMDDERKRIELARFTMTLDLYGEFRCDLHPRWDRTGRMVCVDSAQEGRRAIYTVTLPDPLEG